MYGSGASERNTRIVSDIEDINRLSGYTVALRLLYNAWFCVIDWKVARCSCEVINFEKIITSETNVQKFVNKFVFIFLIALISKFVSIVPIRRFRRKPNKKDMRSVIRRCFPFSPHHLFRATASVV